MRYVHMAALSIYDFHFVYHQEEGILVLRKGVFVGLYLEAKCRYPTIFLHICATK